MNRYRKLNLEVSTRCKICQDIEQYIESLKEELKKDRDLLPWDNSAALKDYIEAEIEDIEVQLLVAHRVIEEILGNLKGNKD